MNLKRALAATSRAAVVLSLACFALGWASQADAASVARATKIHGSVETGFVTLDTGNEVYIEYSHPVQGRPVVLLLNGLTNKVSHWSTFTNQFRGSGIGILRFDFVGQGRTLVKSGGVTRAIGWREQVEDVRALLDLMNVKQPVHVVGLSYGGGIATMFSTIYPKRVASVIAMAPYVQPVESQDRWIQLQIQQTRLLYPLNPHSNDELYDYFLRQLVYSTFPAADPSLLANPFILEGVYQLTQGIRKLLVLDHSHLIPKDKYHLVIARMDQLIPNEIHDNLWSQIPDSSRGSRLYVEFTGHRIPELAPILAGQWARRIVEGDKEISKGRTFVGNPYNGSVLRVQGAN